MNLDFSKLDALKNEPDISNMAEEKTHLQVRLCPANETSLKPEFEENKSIDNIVKMENKRDEVKPYLGLEKEQELSQKAKEAYVKYQENIKLSEALISEINKDVSAGIDPLRVLIKSLECIGAMTGDETFFKTNKEKLLEIQGACLDEDALEIQMEEVSQRLILLQAVENPTPHIKNAIKAHKKKQDELADLCIKSRESR